MVLTAARTGLPPLAEVSDVTDRLPSTFPVDPTRVDRLLRDASARVRSYTNQDFVLAQTTAKLRPVGNRLRLQKRPVVSVDRIAVKVPGTVTELVYPGWWWDGSNEVVLFDEGLVINLAESLVDITRYYSPAFLVTYTAGDSATPDDVLSVVCTMVIRSLTAPTYGAVQSEGVGEYNYRMTDVAVQGIIALTAEEKKVLDPYRARRSTIELRSS